MKKLILLFLGLILISCSSDSPEDVITPTTNYTLAVASSEGGSVSTTGGTYEGGTKLSITATASEGYEFSGWTGSTETSNVINITLNTNITITANFELIEVVETQFTATIIAGNGGTVSTPGGTLNEGTVLSITATPNDGYEFIGWTGSELTSNEVSITVNSDLTLTANFQLIEVATNYYSSGELVANNNISEWFDRSLDVYGIRLLVAGNAGGQIAVPDEWAKKVAQTFKLLIDKDAAGINPVAQEKMIKILLGEEGWHQGLPAGQRIGYGGGNEYSPSPLSDEGISSYTGLQALFDSMALDDMVWYRNVDSQNTGDDDIVELLEHVLHTLHRFGTRGAVEGSLNGLNIEAEEQDITNTEIYLAMIEAHTNGVFDVEGYGGDITNRDAWPVMLKEYQYLLTFGMWGFGTEFWEGGSLAPEWNNNANTPEGVQENNPLGYGLFNNYIAPVLSKPSVNTLRSMFQNNDGGESGYVPDNAAAANTYSISVTASSNYDYTLSGTDVNGTVSGDDASITINAGDTLNFTVDAASHPFYIKTVQGTGTDNQVSNVTNNGATSGVVNWTPTAAGTYYYQCSVHDGMYGTITVQ